MQIELKAFKYSAFASQETACFQAALWINGKKRGTVRNDGHGGCNYFSPYEVEREIDAWAKTLPPCSLGINYGLIPMSAEILIAELVDDVIERRHLKRKCSKATMFREAGKGYARGEYTVINEKFTPNLRAYILNRWPDAVILNESIK
jgi:hypothetical protein